jgi:phage terminase large subunit-like protein
MNAYDRWWWEDTTELALWYKLNSLSSAERSSDKYKDICTEMERRYGKIYFFQPYPAQLPIFKDTNTSVFIHGNNGSGKSYAAAAVTAYEAIGWSPYKTVQPAKYGTKIVWAFSPSFNIQRTSSQVHLFSTDNPNNIGLLPSFNTIVRRGGKVKWFDSRALDFVILPGGTILEFKSGEMATENVQASGIDHVWFDEQPRPKMHDEAMARLFRKRGRMIMSFIVDIEADPDNFIIKDIYRRYLEGDKTVSFYFLDVKDNLSITPEEVDLYKKKFSADSLSWRFSPHGKFQLTPRGDKVYPGFIEEWHPQSGVLDNYDPLLTLWRSWDLGRKHPVCIGAQLSPHGTIDIPFCIMGDNVEITDFISQVENFCNERMPQIFNKYEILPHDANRRYDVYGLSTADIFRKHHLKFDVIYTKGEPALATANFQLQQIRNKRAMIHIDNRYALLLIQCLGLYTYDPKTGKPREDNYFEHPSDAFKQLIAYLDKSKSPDPFNTFDYPRYGEIVLPGAGNYRES